MVLDLVLVMKECKSLDIPGDGDDHAKYGDGGQDVLHGQHVFIVHRQSDEHGKHRAGEESHVFGQHRQQRRNESVHVFGGRFVPTTQPALQLVIQLVKVAQVETAEQWPAPGSQTSRLALDDFSVAKERVQHLPHQHERTQQQIDQTRQQDDAAELLGELLPVCCPFVFGMQTPLVLEERQRAPEQNELKVVF